MDGDSVEHLERLTTVNPKHAVDIPELSIPEVTGVILTTEQTTPASDGLGLVPTDLVDNVISEDKALSTLTGESHITNGDFNTVNNTCVGVISELQSNNEDTNVRLGNADSTPEDNAVELPWTNGHDNSFNSSSNDACINTQKHHDDQMAPSSNYEALNCTQSMRQEIDEPILDQQDLYNEQLIIPQSGKEDLNPEQEVKLGPILDTLPPHNVEPENGTHQADEIRPAGDAMVSAERLEHSDLLQSTIEQTLKAEPCHSQEGERKPLNIEQPLEAGPSQGHDAEPEQPCIEQSNLARHTEEEPNRVEQPEVKHELEQQPMDRKRMDPEQLLEAELALEKERVNEDDPWLYILGNQQLKKRIIRAGEENNRPTHGQRITLRCSGRVDQGNTLSSDHAITSDLVDVHDSLTMVLGDGDFIHAFDLAVALMDRGEVCEMFTDSRFAYGALGRSPDIPPNANLTYTLELLNFEDMPDISTLPVRTRVELGNGKRERGNELYTRQEYSRAIDVYNLALKFLDDENESHSTETIEDLQLLVDTRVKCYNNLAATQLMAQAWDAAIKSSEQVLKVQPQNVKALFRKGKCLAQKGELPAAISLLKKALQLEPDTKIIQQELMRLTKKCKADTANEKALYQKMLGTDKNPSSSASNRKNVQQKSRLWYYAAGAAAACVAAGIATYRYMH